MNQDNQVKIVCPRCGNQMDMSSRCCLRCGWLNPNDPANQNVQQFVSQKENSLYQVGSGQSIVQNSGQVTTSIGSNAGNRTICFIINYLLYISIIIISYLLILGDKVTDFYSVKNSLFPYVAFLTSVVFLYVYSMELVFMKCNKKWWTSLIPIYNLFVLCEIVFKKKWLGIILLIPFIGQVFLLVILYKLAVRFKYNGILAMIFPIIYIPLMGFGSRLYEGINYTTGERGLEKDYRNKKIFFFSLLFFFVVGGGFVFWNNIVEIKTKTFKLVNYYYVFASYRIVDETKQYVRFNNIECEDYDYKATSGIYYFEYNDIGDVTYLPLHYYMDEISAYVIVDNTSGSSKYYVSISDGTYGFAETLSEDVKIDSIVPYEKIVERNNINKCTNVKVDTSFDRQK